MKRDYFVTGATGAIGAAVLPLLLAQNVDRIFALMRGDSQEHVYQRLERLIEFWGLDSEQAKDARTRIVPVNGDMSEPRFGIALPQYKEIAANCTEIIHCAGVVRMNLPLDEARKQAVGAAKNLVELALAAKAAENLRKVEFVSTVGVAGRMTGGVPETWIIQERGFHNTYEAAKAEAEDYLREQAELHDLPVTVHRPSMVVGDSRTGKIVHFQIFYHLCEFLSGRRTAGLFPALGNARLDLVPVDYVAQAITWSSQNHQTIGKIFHLCSGSEGSIALIDLRKIVRKQYKSHALRINPIIVLPLKLFMVLIKMATPFLDERSRRAVGTLPVFLDYLADQQVFTNSDTILYFKENNGPVLPKYQEYLETVLSHYINNR